MSDGIADDLAALDIPARVACAASLLDRVRPGWWREIDVDRILLSNCDKCIVGQLYKSYTGGVGHLMEAVGIADNSTVFSDRYGFESFKGQFRSLADAWRAEIARRAGTAKEEVTT